MIQIPEQVKDAPIVRMKNAVLVGTMKFTLDRFDASFDAEENPAPPLLAAQLAEFRPPLLIPLPPRHPIPLPTRRRLPTRAQAAMTAMEFGDYCVPLPPE